MATAEQLSSHALFEEEYFKRARREMVAGQIHCCNVLEERILESFLAVPREKYLPEHSPMRTYAYADMDLVLPNGPMLMAPRLLAQLIQLAGISPSETVLSVGSAYACAILEHMGVSVNDPALPFYDLAIISAGMIVDAAVSEHGFYLPPFIQEPLFKVKPDGGRVIFVAGPSQHYGYAYTLHKKGEGNHAFSLVKHFDACATPIRPAEY